VTTSGVCHGSIQETKVGVIVGGRGIYRTSPKVWTCKKEDTKEDKGVFGKKVSCRKHKVKRNPARKETRLQGGDVMIWKKKREGRGGGTP